VGLGRGLITGPLVRALIGEVGRRMARAVTSRPS